MFKLVAMLCSFSFAQKTKHLCSFLHCPTAKHELQLFRHKWWNLDYTRIDIQDAFSCGLNGAFLSIDKNRGWSPSLFSSVWIIKIHKCYKIDLTPEASPSLGCNIRRRIFNWNKLQWLMRRGCKNGIPVSVWFNWTSRWGQAGTHWEMAAARSAMKDRLGLCRDNNQMRQPPPLMVWRALYLCCF